MMIESSSSPPMICGRWGWTHSAVINFLPLLVKIKKEMMIKIKDVVIIYEFESIIIHNMYYEYMTWGR